MKTPTKPIGRSRNVRHRLTTTKIKSLPVETSSSVPVRWKWHLRRLQMFREALAEENARHVTEAAAPFDLSGDHFADNATEESERNLEHAVLSESQHAIHEIDEAIQRIRNGTYGICEESGKAIPAERLRAIPWARHTKAVQDRLEGR